MRFVLVHGAYHGAWCWGLLSSELEKLGHVALAVDLPVEVPEAGAAAYADEIAALVGDDEAIVVGHSMMGLAIPLVPRLAPVSRLVFLCAFVPVPGSSINEVRSREQVAPDREIQRVQFTDIGEGVWMIGPDTANELFFHDVSPRLASWAVPLLRPQSYRIMEEITPLLEWPEVDCSYVLCRADRAVDAEWARSTARARLGTVPHELDGGHSPFLTRPAELARLLDRIGVEGR
jgi:pimeloyl-ACP methyl ester carboxylesterase